MRRLYYSNYIEKLTDGNKVAFYHSLNGNFIIFSNITVVKLIDDIVLKNQYPTKNLDKILERLLDEEFLLESFMTEEEEKSTYDDSYLVVNKTIFNTWIGGTLELTIPSTRKVRRIKLNRKYGELWLKLNEHNMQLKDIGDDFFIFNSLSNYKNSLFKLVRKEELNSKFIFSNLYLSNYYDMAVSHNESSPSSLYLKLTDACNLNCKMCGQANNKKLGVIKNQNFLEFNAVKKFIEPIMNKVEFINLWGGEPMLHPEIINFIEYFVKNKKYVSIATNGSFLKKYAKDLINLGVDEIVISLDGPREIHNKIRGKNSSFDDIKVGINEIHKLKNFKQMKPKLFLNCTITEENVDYLEEVLEIGQSWKVNKLIYQLPMFITEAEGNKYSKLCNKIWGITPNSWKGFVKNYNFDLDKLYNFYENVNGVYSSFVDFYNISFNSKEKLSEYFNNPEYCLGKSKCLILDTTLVIESNGDLAICPDFPDIKYKNIKEADSEEFWNSNIRKEFIENFNKECYSICKRCCQFV